jgi:diguanylate cyclase (GGDEF)-like protein
LRDVDWVARYGGEEFFVLMPETTADEAANLAKRVRAQLAKRPPPAGAVTLSFGVAAYPSNGLNGEALIAAADEALYDAKNAGRDCVAVARTAARVKAARG